MNKGILYNLPDKYKKSVVFSSKVRSVVAAEKDKYLSLASLDNLRKFIPNIDIEKNVDLLPFATDAFVANRLNLNGHGVKTAEAISIAKNFKLKPVDIEHSRNNVVGIIVEASYSEFGSNKPLTEEEVKDFKKPFNVTLGGVIWKVFSGNLAEILEESNNPESEHYMSVSASWEVCYNLSELILLPKDKKNFEDGEVIDNKEDIAKLEEKYGEINYSSETEDGKKIGIIFSDDVLPVGLGFVEDPAADVKGVAINLESEEDPEEEKEEEANINTKNSEININTLNFNSQSQKANVKKDSKVMILKSIKDINDEVLKEAKAADIHTLIEDRVKEIDTNYQNKLAEESRKAAEASAKFEEVQKKLDEVNKILTDNQSSLENVTKQYNELVEAAKVKEEEEKFSTRMSAFDEAYTLEQDDRDVIASLIKDVKDEVYDVVASKIKTLLKGKEKKAAASKEAVASVEAKKEEEVKKEVVGEAIEAGKKEGSVAATTTLTESLADKMKIHFGNEGWEIKKKRF